MPVVRSLPLRPRSRLERGAVEDAKIDLLATDAWVREAACEGCELDPVGVHALRDVLLLDSHAIVRRAAAMRLASTSDPALAAIVTGWLVEALADRFPSVRDSVCHALARLGRRPSSTPSDSDPRPSPAAGLARRMSEDPIWWVRRAAARALALVLGEASPREAVAALIPGLSDPFWRVRHGVVQALAIVIAHVEEPGPIQRELIELGETLPDEVARAALIYLAREWPIGEDFPALAGSVGDPASLELDDPDPAVVTAALMRSTERDPARLIPLLAESHEPLRREAVRRLAGLRRPDAIRPALAWLEDPRVPNATNAVARLLDGLADRARGLAEHALSSGRPGAVAWAARWVAEHPADELHRPLLRHAAHADRRARVGVVEACAGLLARERSDEFMAVLVGGLGDCELDVRDAAAVGLVMAGEGRRAIDHLRRISPAIRARILARTELDSGALRVWADDADGRVRAAAVSRLAERGELVESASVDPDPLVRAAGLDSSNAAELLGDPDASVRRAAGRLLVRLGRSGRGTEGLGVRTQHSEDAWLRAAGLALLDLDLDRDFAALLAATRDRSAMVRAAALDRLPDGDVEPRLEQVLAIADDPELRKAAWTHRLMRADPDQALGLIDAAVESESPGVVEHLHAIAVVFGREPVVVYEPSVARVESRPREPVRADVERRPLGDSGVTLAPIVVSGAFGLTPSSLAFAVEHGVDTLFWEPRYANLGRFLRQPIRRDLQVITGSFHADRAGLEFDLDVARRRLERETIDVFLLFWTRSPARLSSESLDVLREFQARGAIRTFGFSTHDRAIGCEAIATGEWPVVMTRHSAAHPGAEVELFPSAESAGVGVLGFSALCYGRMLRGSSVFERGPEAADCYRYSLGQPGVSACISAPRRFRELAENLDVLARPGLAPELGEALRSHGREVHADNKRFDRLVRRGGAGPLREAVLELFERAGDPDDSRLED